MTIERQHGELVMTCDECGTEFCGGCEDDFARFVQDAKREGWKVLKEGDEWLHNCPECRSDRR